jgi:hypothetical protein
MKYDSRPQQLERLLYLGRLGKATQAGHQAGIDPAARCIKNFQGIQCLSILDSPYVVLTYLLV